MKRAVASALRLGADGIRIACAGRLGGGEIARREWYRDGRVPLHTIRADIDYGGATPPPTHGPLGVKGWGLKGGGLAKAPPGGGGTGQAGCQAAEEPPSPAGGGEGQGLAPG